MSVISFRIKKSDHFGHYGLGELNMNLLCVAAQWRRNDFAKCHPW